MYRPNVAIIVTKQNQVLLVHKPRVNDAWQFPQGGVDAGENEEQAAVRELHEETGLNNITLIKKSEHTYQYDFPNGHTRYREDGPNYIGQKQSFYLAELTQENKIELQPEELDDYKWVSPLEISQYIERPEYLDICNQVLKEFGII
jgi:putative (di)nucleoside polyphosphate hydrolase